MVAVGTLAKSTIIVTTRLTIITTITITIVWPIIIEATRQITIIVIGSTTLKITTLNL
jgi:hypothetical protein